jgi:hypothetical protein
MHQECFADCSNSFVAPKIPHTGSVVTIRREIGWIVIREVRYGEKEERELGEIHRCIVLIKE